MRMSNANRQADLFAGTKDLFDPAPGTDQASMEPIARAKLNALLAMARSAETCPWPPHRAGVQPILFYNMANWLPEPERETMRAAFRAECVRLQMDLYPRP